MLKSPRVSLTSLIQHKSRATQTYPAKVSDMVNGVAFVDVMPPILRKMQDEQTQVSSASTMSSCQCSDWRCSSDSSSEWRMVGEYHSH